MQYCIARKMYSKKSKAQNEREAFSFSALSQIPHLGVMNHTVTHHLGLLQKIRMQLKEELSFNPPPSM